MIRQSRQKAARVTTHTGQDPVRTRTGYQETDTPDTSRHPHDPPGLNRLGRAEIAAEETADAKMGKCRFRLWSGHPEHTHGAEIDAFPATVAEDAIDEHLHQDSRRG